MHCYRYGILQAFQIHIVRIVCLYWILSLGMTHCLNPSTLLPLQLHRSKIQALAV